MKGDADYCYHSSSSGTDLFDVECPVAEPGIHQSIPFKHHCRNSASFGDACSIYALFKSVAIFRIAKYAIWDSILPYRSTPCPVLWRWMVRSYTYTRRSTCIWLQPTATATAWCYGISVAAYIPNLWWWRPSVTCSIN